MLFLKNRTKIKKNKITSHNQIKKIIVATVRLFEIDKGMNSKVLKIKNIPISLIIVLDLFFTRTGFEINRTGNEINRTGSILNRTGESFPRAFELSPMWAENKTVWVENKTVWAENKTVWVENKTVWAEI